MGLEKPEVPGSQIETGSPPSWSRRTLWIGLPPIKRIPDPSRGIDGMLSPWGFNGRGLSGTRGDCTGCRHADREDTRGHATTGQDLEAGRSPDCLFRPWVISTRAMPA